MLPAYALPPVFYAEQPLARLAREIREEIVKNQQTQQGIHPAEPSHHGYYTFTMRSVVISRHALLDAQQQALRDLGAEVIEICEQYDPDRDNTRWKEQGVEAVFTVALPPLLLARLSESFRVFTFDMESVGMAESKEQAEAWCAQAPAVRSYLPAREGSLRLLEFRGVSETKIQTQTTRVWEVKP